MSVVTTVQPDGTPTWIDLGIPDLERAMDFYGALFDWKFEVGPEDYGSYTTCFRDGKQVAALMPHPDPQASAFWWNVYFAASDCDATARRAVNAGGAVLTEPMDVMDQGRMAIVCDNVGAQFGLWQAGAHIGCERVNEAGALLRNDLVTATPDPARTFYAAVFDYTLDGNPDLPGWDFTFLRRPDGHEIGGIIGDPSATRSSWTTLFQVEDTDATAAVANERGGSANEPQDFTYGRISTITDPFGAEFTVGAPPAA
jgi:uncharacterized protein